MVTSDKFFSEFCLTQERHDLLEAYLKDRYGALQAEFRRCRAGEYFLGTSNPQLRRLKEFLDEILPEEVGLELRSVFGNRSDHIIVIHNTPELLGLERNLELDNRDVDQNYSFFIGAALYAKYDLYSHMAMLWRRPKNKVENPQWHRDFLGDHIIFSSPYNGECASTGFLKIGKVIDSLSKETLKNLNVRAEYILGSFFERELREVKLKDIILKPESSNKLRSMNLVSDPNSDPYAAEFLRAVAEHSRLLEIKPGMLVIICEDSIFHSAQPGKKEKIERLPTEQHTRLFIHNAGKPVLFR